MDAKEARGLARFAKRYVLPIVIGLLLFVGIVGGSMWYALSGVGRSAPPVSSFGIPTGATSTIATSTSMIARHIDGVMVMPGADALPSFAVMIDGHADARPVSGLSQANLVFDVPVEGGITRYMAVFDASSTATQIGPVRSAREYFVELAVGMGAVYGHVGGSPQALDTIKGLSSFRDLNEYYNGQYYWRSTDRVAPHNAYTSMDQLNTAYTAKNWTPGQLASWTYKDDDTIDGAASTTARGTAQGPGLTYAIPYGIKWSYDRPSNEYVRRLNGQAQNDAEGGAAISAKNVMVVSMPTTLMDSYGRLAMPTTGRGTAVLYRDGYAFQCVWRRTAGGMLHFETIDGSDALFDRGTTWVEIVGDPTVFNFAASTAGIVLPKDVATP